MSEPCVLCGGSGVLRVTVATNTTALKSCPACTTTVEEAWRIQQAARGDTSGRTFRDAWESYRKWVED